MPSIPTKSQFTQLRASTRTLFLLGGASLIIWLILFTMGLLIETVEERLMLAPRSVSRQLGTEGIKSLSSQAKKEYQEYLTNKAVSQNPKKQVSVEKVNHQWFDKIIAFVICFLCFTPTNIALLTLCAGLAGGCASNISISYLRKQDRKNLMKQNPERYFYLREPPVTAALRGFVVFLCVIAGLYIAIEDPFRDPTPAQYLRLAGLLSVLAFLVGYDPTRLEDWLRLVPSPGGKTKENNDVNYDELIGKHFAKHFDIHMKELTTTKRQITATNNQEPEAPKIATAISQDKELNK